MAKVTKDEKEYIDNLYDALCANEGWHKVPEVIEKEVEELLTKIEKMDPNYIDSDSIKAFSSEVEAIQYLSDITGKKVIVSGIGLLEERRGIMDVVDESKKEEVRKMYNKGYRYIAQIETIDGNFGEPLYFRDANEFGPFLRSFPDYKKAKTKWNYKLEDMFK